MLLHFCQCIIYAETLHKNSVEFCLTILIYYHILKSERMFVYFNKRKGNIEKMTENKVELVKLILENVDVEQAVLTAAAIISDFLKQYESNQEQNAACQ